MKTFQSGLLFFGLAGFLPEPPVSASPSAEWVGRAYAEGQTSIVAGDGSGSSYVVGSYSATASFGGIKMLSAGMTDCFFVKYSPAGEVLWAQSVGGMSGDSPSAIAVDTEGNSVVIVHSFGQSIAVAGRTLSIPEGFRAFILAFSPSGQLRWWTTMPFVSSVSISPRGNVHLGGEFNGQWALGNQASESHGANDVFVAKMTANGELLYLKAFGGLENDTAKGVATDAQENVYITGYFSQRIEFGALTLTENSEPRNDNIFVSKLDSVGKPIWAIHLADVFPFEPALVVRADTAGNAFVIGTVGTNATFHGVPLGGELSLPEKNDDLFVAKIDANGRIAWANRFSTPGYDYAKSAAVSRDGVLYIGGSSSGSTIHWSDGTTQKQGKEILTILKYLPSGQLAGAHHYLADDAGIHGVSLSSDNALFVSGWLTRTNQFGTIKVESAFVREPFVMKLKLPVSMSPVLAIEESPEGVHDGFDLTPSAVELWLPGQEQLVRFVEAERRLSLTSENPPDGDLHSVIKRYKPLLDRESDWTVMIKVHVQTNSSNLSARLGLVIHDGAGSYASSDSSADAVGILLKTDDGALRLQNAQRRDIWQRDASELQPEGVISLSYRAASSSVTVSYRNGREAAFTVLGSVVTSNWQGGLSMILYGDAIGRTEGAALWLDDFLLMPGQVELGSAPLESLLGPSVMLRWNSNATAGYRLQGSPDMIDWHNGTVREFVGDGFEVQVRQTLSDRFRFYRIRVLE